MNELKRILNDTIQKSLRYLRTQGQNRLRPFYFKALEKKET